MAHYSTVPSNLCLCRCPCHFKNGSGILSDSGSRHPEVGSGHQVSSARNLAPNEIGQQNRSTNLKIYGGEQSSYQNVSNPASKVPGISSDTVYKSQGNISNGSRSQRNNTQTQAQVAVTSNFGHDAQGSNHEASYQQHPDSDSSTHNNPFKSNGESAIAAASKSFLQAKKIVQQMTRKWESLSDQPSDDTLVKKQSLTARSPDHENSSVDWTRQHVDEGDQSRYEWKQRRQVPGNMEENAYSFEPLQTHRNLRTLNHDSYLSASRNHNELSSSNNAKSVHSPNSFRQIPDFDAAPSEREQDLSRQTFQESSKSRAISENAKESKYRPVHSTNPFKQTETKTHPDKMEVSNKNSNPSAYRQPIKSHSIHSIQSEVKNIRKSFEDEVQGILENVKRRSYDADNHYFHSEQEQEIMPDMNVPLKSHYDIELPTIGQIDTPNPPHLVQSEIRRIRKSFEDETDQIVENVNKQSHKQHEEDFLWRSNVPIDMGKGSEKISLSPTSWVHKSVIPSKSTKSMEKDDMSPSKESFQAEVKNIGESSREKVSEIADSVNKRFFDTSPSVSNRTTPVTNSRAQLSNSKPVIENSRIEAAPSSRESRINASHRVDPNVAIPLPPPPNNSRVGVIPSADRQTVGASHSGRVWNGVKTSPSLDLKNPENYSLLRQSEMLLYDYDNMPNQRVLPCQYQVATTKQTSQKSGNVSSNKVLPTSSRSNSEKTGKVEGHASGHRQITAAGTKSGLQVANPSNNLAVVRDSHSNHPLENTCSRCKSNYVSASTKNVSKGGLPVNSSANSMVVRESESRVPIEKSCSRCESNNVSASSKPLSNGGLSVKPSDQSKQPSSKPQMLDSMHGNQASVQNTYGSTDTKAKSVQDSMAPSATRTADQMGKGKREQEYERVPSYIISNDYNEVVATPSNLRMETVVNSVSVVNNLPIIHQNQLRFAGDSNNNPSIIIQSTMRQMQDRRCKGISDSFCPSKVPHRGKKEFYICPKCHKIVESRNALYRNRHGIEDAWHPQCFKCSECEKELSQTDHHFFDDELYCREHFVRVAKIPKCFKCQTSIYDFTYTSAAGNSWHQHHFTCHDCKKALVDTKYVFVENKDPYCLQCHAKHFPKQCQTCRQHISPQEPYIQGGGLFWHCSSSCLQCCRCNSSLAGRSLFFQKDGHLYCNKYCAVREM